MTLESVEELAEALPEHQSSRGAEFRDVPVEDRLDLARWLAIARIRVDGGRDEWVVDAKTQVFYEAGKLGIDRWEMDRIWWSVVYDDLDPYEINERV